MFYDLATKAAMQEKSSEIVDRLVEFQTVLNYDQKENFVKIADLLGVIDYILSGELTEEMKKELADAEDSADPDFDDMTPDFTEKIDDVI